MALRQSVEVEANVTADQMGISPRGDPAPLEALADPVKLATPKRRPSWKMRWKLKSKASASSSSSSASKGGSTSPEVAAREASRTKAEHRASLGGWVGTECKIHLEACVSRSASTLLLSQHRLIECGPCGCGDRTRSKYRVAATRWPRTLFPPPRNPALNLGLVAGGCRAECESSRCNNNA